MLVTGGTNGIGLAGVRRIAAEGGQVIVTGTNAERSPTTPRASTPGAELAAAVASGGPVDGVWLNAGYGDIRAVDEVDPDFFYRMMAVNVRAPFLQLAALGPPLRDGASVVVTSSAGEVEGSLIATVHAAAKGALESAACGWATAFAPRRIQVNVCFGATDTTVETGLDHYQVRDCQASGTGSPHR